MEQNSTTLTTPDGTIPRQRSSGTSRRIKAVKAFLEALLYLSPSLILFAAFVFIPLLRSFEISAYITDPIGRLTRFVGLLNYERMFASAGFRTSLARTFLFILYTVPATLLVALGNLRLKGISFFRMVFSITIAISGATASLMFLYLYHPTVGINYLLSLVGITNVTWLVSQNTALFSIALTTIWLQVGLSTVILLAAMQTIPEELLEAAMIDGANAWNKFWHITIPMLSSTFFFLLVVNTLAAFQTFTPIHIMTKGGPLESTNLLVYSIYREFYFNGRYGFAAAQSIVLFFIMLLFTIAQFVFVERKVFYE
jgi:sn-glycerol 3-phosphate transport system permease protein